MDWQDELRKLDKQLSEGDISAQQYRRLRDELLAEASAPAQGRGARRPGRPDRPDAVPGAPAPDADDTQIVEDATVTVDEGVVSAANARKAADPDKTDTVSGDPDKTVNVTVDARDTRVVEEPVTTKAVGQPIARAFRKPAAKPAAPPAAKSPSTPTAPPAAKPPAKMRPRALRKPLDESVDEPAIAEIAWPTTEEESDKKKKKVPTFPPRPSDTPAPPAPPLPKPAPYTGHQVLGEEVFADAGPHSNARRAATMLLSIVAVLAVVGGGVWYFVFRNEDPPAAQQPNTPPGTTAQSQAPSQPESTQPPSAEPGNVPPNLADVIGPLPGAADKNSGTISAARAGQLKLVSPEEVKAAQDAGVVEVIFRGSTKGTVGNGLLVFTTPDAGAAADLTDAERKNLRDDGFTNGKELRNGLPVLVRSTDAGTVYRVVYSTGKYTVRFGVAQLDADPDELRRELEAMADTILAVLPSSG